MDIPPAYLKRAKSLFPERDFQTLFFNQDGLVNNVLIADGSLVFRFAKHPDADVRREAVALELLSEYVTVPVPKPIVSEPDLLVYPYIEGIPLSRRRLLGLAPATRKQVLGTLAGFLSELHAVPTVAVETASLGQSQVNRTKDDWATLLERVRSRLFPHLMRHQRDEIEAHFAPVLSGQLELATEAKLVHGDLGVYHLLFDPDAEVLTGVIDVGTLGIGDPAVDLAALLGQYGEGLVAEMLPVYPALQAYLPRARFWAGTAELQWALAGVEGSTELALAHLGGARDILPGGQSVK